jgi:hypothetical protein
VYKGKLKNMVLMKTSSLNPTLSVVPAATVKAGDASFADINLQKTLNFASFFCMDENGYILQETND